MNSDAKSGRPQWQLRYEQSARRPLAAQVLRDYVHLLPDSGSALDLACGLGGNAFLMAQKGLAVHAWDYAAAALEQLEQFAQSNGLVINTELRDVVQQPPPVLGFDVIAVSRFLERGLCPDLVRALKPGGLLFYQTFIRDKCEHIGPRRAAFVLAPNELLALFRDLDVLAYREESGLAADDSVYRNEALLVARKPLR